MGTGWRSAFRCARLTAGSFFALLDGMKVSADVSFAATGAPSRFRATWQ
jgi:hypothetical protein